MIDFTKFGGVVNETEDEREARMNGVTVHLSNSQIDPVAMKKALEDIMATLLDGVDSD